MPVVTTSFLLHSTLESFDQEAFKASIARTLGVAPSAVSLNLKQRDDDSQPLETAVAHGLAVEAQTVVQDDVAAEVAIEKLSASVEVTSKALGVEVMSVPMPTVGKSVPGA